VAFDPFLYVAFAAGFLAGRLVRQRSPWIGRATLATIAVLVGLLGASLAGVPSLELLATIPLAAAFALAILVLTAVVYLGLARFVPPTAAPAASPTADPRLPLSLALLAALGVGFALGRVTGSPPPDAIPAVLYVLLALVGFDVTLTVAGLRGVWAPLAAATVGALGAAVLFAGVGAVPLGGALATSLAFGFYSLAGPLVAARVGALLGLLAFLVNFLREDLTMLLAPYVGPRLRGGGLASLGGATSMDTTLYFVTRYGARDAGSLALATGLVLTIVATLAVPAVLAIP
jgi:uncharacterized membrane protein YbjE (DUF340 family)